MKLFHGSQSTGDKSRVKLSLTGKCQSKHTDLFDVSVVIIINVGHALSSPWKSPQRMGSLTHFLGQWNITIVFYIQQKLKIRISSTSVRNSLSYLPFCSTPLGKRLNVWLVEEFLIFNMHRLYFFLHFPCIITHCLQKQNIPVCYGTDGSRILIFLK